MLRPIILACILIGLAGQLTLQTQALPNEAPRITLERLTGLHIGPAATDTMSTDCAALMHMPSHDNPHNNTSNKNTPCPLCPLLHLPAIILGLAIIALLIARLHLTADYSPAPLQRLSARRTTLLPPATGPPLFA